MSFREKLVRFFYGRYGIDGLGLGLIVCYFLVWSAQTFTLLFTQNTIVKYVFWAVEAAIIFFAVFRMLSKNLYRRRRENDAFMKAFRNTKNFIILTKNKIRDFKSYRYKTCPYCKATLRLPKRKGEHSVVCPRCKKRFTAKTIF